MNKTLKLLVSSFCLASLVPASGFADAENASSHARVDALETVYTLSNNATQNEVLAFRLDESGHMQPAGRYATGGTGTGSGLGNQGAMALSESGRYLFAINAGSNDVSVFRIKQGELQLVDRAAEEGVTPVSVTVDHNRVYVVNSGDDSIFGFQFDPPSGKLKPLQGSYQKLSGAGTAPAQISFDRDGNALVVTEKATNKITTYALGDNGIPQARHVIDSAGRTPFGFAFGKRDQFFVAEAQGGAANGATASSYQLLEDGTARPIDGAVAVGQTAACWLATTPNGRIAFTADTPANAISSFTVTPDGHLKLWQTRAADENHPTDLAVSAYGRTLYTLSGGDHSIGVYRIGDAGTLQKQDSLAALPPGVTGLVVR